MPVFPPEAPVTVLIDGRPLLAYVRAYAVDGRVFAPVSPLLTRLADRVWFEDGTLVVERAGRRIRVRLPAMFPNELDEAYVAVGPVLRALGDSVRYESRARRLDVRTPPPRTVASPTPYGPRAPAVPASAVFTPRPISTPRPMWTGSPLPRRTPLPANRPPQG